jgi:thioredoxin reductase (NADPH)
MTSWWSGLVPPGSPPRSTRHRSAVFLADIARRVYLVVRGGDLYRDMSTYLARRIEQTPNIEVLLNTEVFIRTGSAVTPSARWTARRQPFLLETSRPGVFAAGDVRAGSIERVASAVGEGAMAIAFVHEFLRTG